MGKKQTNIGVKLDEKQLGRLDAEISIWGPFCSKRSTMGAALIEVALDAIEAGIIQRPPWTTQGLPGTKRLEKAEGSDKGTKVSERVA